MQLLRGMLRDMSITLSSAEPTDDGGRWEQLSKDYCNPWPELEFLESKLDRPVPTAPPGTSRRASFQPGTYSRSFSVDGTWIDKLLPAYQYMRLVEDAPYPPRFGFVTQSEKLLRTSAEWFIIHDPVRTQSLICRLLDEKLIDIYFSRHRVAVLSAEVIENFVKIAKRTIEQAIPDSMARHDAESSAFVDRADRRLQAGVDLLSRLVIRLSSESCSEICTQAIQLFTLPTVQNSHSLPQILCELFRSLIVCMPREDLESRLIDLVSLPIPGSNSFPVKVPDLWREFFLDLIDQLPATGQRSDSERWTTAIRNLLDAAGDKNEKIRGRAIMRLYVLYRHGYLEPAETDALGRVYWAHGGKPTTVPTVYGLSNSVCLDLPEPSVGLAVRLFRQYALNAKLHPLVGGMSDANSLLRDWLNATQNWNFHLHERAVHVDWTEEEVGILVEAIREWWDSSGRAKPEIPITDVLGGIRRWRAP